MNQLELKNWRGYSPTAGNRLQSVKSNAIFVHNNNSVKHELAKCVSAIMLHKWGDVLYDEKLNDAIQNVSDIVSEMFKKWDVNPTSFLTEAWANKERRIDLVDLKRNIHFEFETNPKIKPKEGAVTIYV